MGDDGGGLLISPDGVAPSRIVSVSASVNLPLHDKVQKFSSGTSLPRWFRKKGHKTVVVVRYNLNDRAVMEFESESECCRIPTIFCKSEIQRIFRLIWTPLSFWKAQVHHSS